MAEHKKSSKLTPILGVLFSLGMLYFEGGVWRLIVFITVGLGLFASLAYWLFERAERKRPN